MSVYLMGCGRWFMLVSDPVGLGVGLSLDPSLFYQSLSTSYRHGHAGFMS